MDDKPYEVFEVGFRQGRFESLEQAQAAANRCWENAQIYHLGNLVEDVANNGVSG